jgi:1-acyl-sn-glycerol-3-phosphate acyltransferase
VTPQFPAPKLRPELIADPPAPFDTGRVRRVKEYLTGDSYATPADAHRSLFSRLLFGWSWAFYLEWAPVVIESHFTAVRGRLDDASWMEESMYVFRTIERHRGRFDIRGLDNIRSAASKGPFVFVANHMSTLETQVLHSFILPTMPVTYVVKESLVKGWLFGPIMRSRKPIAVGRRSAREDLESVLDQGVARLQGGMSIIIFPQATRSPVFDPRHFNTLGVKLAARAGVPLFPVAVKTDFWGEKGLLRGFGAVRPEHTAHIEFGRPVEVTGRGKEQHLAVVEFISSRLARWAHEERAAREAGGKGQPRRPS